MTTSRQNQEEEKMPGLFYEDIESFEFNSTDLEELGTFWQEIYDTVEPMGCKLDRKTPFNWLTDDTFEMPHLRMKSEWKTTAVI